MKKKEKKKKKKENIMLMSAIKSIKVAKLVFTQKEFDKEKKVNLEEFDNNKWHHPTCKGDQETCAKPKR